MDPILLQKQIKDNAEDLKSYMNDLKIWEFEMKRKESEMNSTESGSQVQPPVRSKINKVSNGKGQIKSKNVQSEHEHKMERDSLNQTGKPRKISGFDYASWDKFDVDKACEELDTDHQSSGNEDEPVTDMEEEKKREEALYEKERGNVFVKSGKWKEAIQCYSRAISCYRHDAIFYANRALCYLKIQELKSAEADCTTALQLDSNYVKAYQRRAMARVGLGQLTEAKVDLQRVLDIEPKNTASKAELLKIEKKLNSKIEQIAPKPSQELKSHKALNDAVVKQSKANETRKEIKNQNTQNSFRELYNEASSISSTENTSNETAIEKQTKCTVNHNIIEKQSAKLTLNDTTHKQTLWPDEETVKLVEPIQKPPHLRSKKPLQRISIKDVDNSPVMQNTVTLQDLPSFKHTIQEQKHTKSEDRSEGPQSTAKNEKKDGITRDTSAVNRTFEPEENSKNLKPDVAFTDHIPPAPSTSVQFYVSWKKVRTNPELSYLYLKVELLDDSCGAFRSLLTSSSDDSKSTEFLKFAYRYIEQIPGSDIPKLFRDSLESSTFSDIINTIGKTFLQNKETVLPYIVGLTKVRRFAALIMFLTETDKEGIRKILQYCREQGECTEDDFRDLKKQYELL